MPTGRLEIKRISPESDQDVTWDVTFLPVAGGSYAAGVPADELDDFLAHKLRLAPGVVEGLREALRRHGQASLAEMTIAEIELIGSGMEYLEEEG